MTSQDKNWILINSQEEEQLLGPESEQQKQSQQLNLEAILLKEEKLVTTLQAEHKIRKAAWLVVCLNNAHFDQSLVQTLVHF